jgi:serine/threonine protein kinase
VNWARIEEILAGALEREPAERGAFLDHACAGDATIRAEVDSLLAAHERLGAVDRMAADFAPVAARLRRSAVSLAGKTIGPYEVREEIGGGAMGVVYQALDTRLDRTVALKFLRPHLGTDDSASERFRLEARTVGGLEHPTLCTLHDIGEAEPGQLYLAMPLYDGETLQRRIARGPLPVEEAVGIAIQIARGLAKAHARGIIHRDIKPANVLVTGDGVVKILDFGIAKLAGVVLTGPSTVLGTLGYMSPEQAEGEPLDHRTDLWSLGVVLYEMLAGRRPFPGGTPSAVAEAILSGDPAPLSGVRPAIPGALDSILATALGKTPAMRYQSAQAFERELLGLGLTLDLPAGFTPSGGLPPAGVPPRASAPRQRWTVVAALVLAAGAMALAVWALSGAPVHLAAP